MDLCLLHLLANILRSILPFHSLLTQLSPPPIHLQLPPFRELNPLRQRRNTRINGIPLILKLLALHIQIPQLDIEDLNELILLQLRDGVLVLLKTEINGHMHHLRVGVAEAGICERLEKGQEVGGPVGRQGVGYWNSYH